MRVRRNIHANIEAAHDARRSRFSTGHWLLAADDLPPLGAHLVTARSGYTHHGIYVGGGKVVHYAGLSHGWRSGPVEEISIARFTHGQRIWVRVYSNPRFDPGEVVARARSRMGEDRYRLLSNNCEHLCRWCVRGESRSGQVETWCSLPRRVLSSAWAAMHPLSEWRRERALYPSPSAVTVRRRATV